jgi:cytochrome P450
MQAERKDQRTSSLDSRLQRIFASEPDAIRDPFPTWNELREAAPVHYFGDAWLVSHYKAVRVLADDARVGNNAYLHGSRGQALRNRLSPQGRIAFDEVSAFEALYMSRTEGETHDRLRRIAQRTFTPRRIAQIQERIRTLTESLLDELEREEIADVRKFAYRLPLLIIGEMLGIPVADLDQVHEWSGKLGRNRGGSEELPLLEAHSAMKSFKSYVEQLIAQLRSRPKQESEISLLGDLLDASQSEVLNEAELTAMFVVLLFAGHETTTNLISGGLLAMLRSGQWNRLCQSPDIINSTVEEVLRFVSPVQWIGRFLKEPAEIEGHRLKEGDTLLLMLAAANRDPDVFENPDVLDLGRKGARNHVAFGTGSHFCLGSPLARMEAAIAFSSIARRFPGIRLAAEEVSWGGNAMLRTLTSLPVELNP